MAGFISGGGGDGGADYVQDTEPADPEDGDLWVDTTNQPHVLKEYDAVAAAWESQVGQTEFGNHETAASAHHARPTGTQSATKAGGYDRVIGPQTLSGSSTPSAKWTGNTFADEVKLYFDDSTSNSFSYEVELEDGTVYTGSESASNVSSGWSPVVTFAEQSVVRVQMDTNYDCDGGSYADIHKVALPTHSHGI